MYTLAYTLVKVQKTPVIIEDVTLAHLSHLFLGVPGGKLPTNPLGLPKPGALSVNTRIINC